MLRQMPPTSLFCIGPSWINRGMICLPWFVFSWSTFIYSASFYNSFVRYVGRLLPGLTHKWGSKCGSAPQQPWEWSQDWHSALPTPNFILFLLFLKCHSCRHKAGKAPPSHYNPGLQMQNRSDIFAWSQHRKFIHVHIVINLVHIVIIMYCDDIFLSHLENALWSLTYRLDFQKKNKIKKFKNTRKD